MALTLAFRRDATTAAHENAIREITETLQKADGRIAYVYVHSSHLNPWQRPTNANVRYVP